MTKQVLKQDLRKKYLNLRKHYFLHDTSSKQICEYLLELLAPYKKIALYYPIKNEVNVWPVVEKLHKIKDIYLPISKDQLSFRKITDLNKLNVGKMNILEPTGPKINDNNDLEVIVIPSIAISPAGYRLGFGKGYYDFALQYYFGLKVGVIYSIQETDVEFSEAHDLQFNIIVSEKGFRKIGEINV